MKVGRVSEEGLSKLGVVVVFWTSRRGGKSINLQENGFIITFIDERKGVRGCSRGSGACKIHSGHRTRARGLKKRYYKKKYENSSKTEKIMSYGLRGI